MSDCDEGFGVLFQCDNDSPPPPEHHVRTFKLSEFLTDGFSDFEFYFHRHKLQDALFMATCADECSELNRESLVEGFPSHPLIFPINLGTVEPLFPSKRWIDALVLPRSLTCGTLAAECAMLCETEKRMRKVLLEAPLCSRLEGELTVSRSTCHSSLWGHLLWNSARCLVKRLLMGDINVRGATVVELGAGLGVPGLIAAQMGAKKVCLTDYPEKELIDILTLNARDNAPSPPGNIVVESLIWGKKEMLERVLMASGNGTEGFDFVFATDCLFNHICHDELLASISFLLSKRSKAAAYIVFGHHPTRNIDQIPVVRADLQFFEKCNKHGLMFSKVDEEIYDCKFDDDTRPEKVRRRVHCYVLRHIDST